MRLLDAIRDPRLFAEPFAGPSWAAWRVLLAALFAGACPDARGLQTYRELTGREKWPTVPFGEGWFVIGRRGGKSQIAALIAVFLACFRDYRRILAAGERGTLMVIAADKRQARAVFRYIRGLIESVPMLEKMVEHQTQERIDLRNRVTIEVHVASFRAVRGYTLIGAVLDKVAFWQDESSANPDVEIAAALRPAMATVPGALLIGISSPYSRRGLLWEQYRRHFGHDHSRVLVAQAPSRTMNPTLPEHVVAEALTEDEPRAAAEYLARWRSDIEAFISREAVEACVVPERRELPPQDGVRYYAHIDPSGGSADSMTLAIAHEEKRSGARWAVLDLIREVKPPFAPTQVVADFADDQRRYRITDARANRYAANWVTEAFRAEASA